MFVSGEDFSDGMVATFGGVEAGAVTVSHSTGFSCTVPEGSGTVDVVVTVGGKSSKGPAGNRGVVKFIYV